MSDYDLYVKHDHYHHIVNPNQPNYTGNDDDSSSYDDSSSSTDSSSDTSSYADSGTTPNDVCTDANHNGQCDVTEMPSSDLEPCQELQNDCHDVATDNAGYACDSSNDGDSGGYDGSSDCGCDSGGSDSGSSGDGSASH